MTRLSRRHVLAGAAGTAAIGAAGLSLSGRARAFPGRLGGADMQRGHRLRDGTFPLVSGQARTRIAIIGGGVAGLSAAWALAEAGVHDFRLFELEDSTGGNARSGRNAVSAYPLGAHYLPIPNAEASGVRHLLERLGIITGWEGGRPIFDPYQVVADPDERLLHLGRWQDGLVPHIGLSAADRHDIDSFFAAMAGYRDRRGTDGRPAFAIPMDFSSRDPEFLALDHVNFAAWLDAEGWRSSVLRWHIRYACRDDYGTEPEHVSAWAGVHYFASRRGQSANCGSDAVLTWPEGNGHLVQALAHRVQPQIASGQVVHHVERTAQGAIVDSFDVTQNRTTRWTADAVIAATPHFVTARLFGGKGGADFHYAPWVVANVTVDRMPAGPGVALAWDNVSTTSASLGYVVATHQALDMVPGASVLTWYMPLSDMAPADARRLMVDRPLEAWQQIVAADLLQTNPDLDGAIRRIDVWRWGHAMIRPEPGFMWGEARQAAARPQPPFFFAHSDLSGLSLFEEAHYRGTRAAEGVMDHLGISYRATLDG